MKKNLKDNLGTPVSHEQWLISYNHYLTSALEHMIKRNEEVEHSIERDFIGGEYKLFLRKHSIPYDNNILSVIRGLKESAARFKK
jgi:hypothetical protein